MLANSSQALRPFCIKLLDISIIIQIENPCFESMNWTISTLSRNLTNIAEQNTIAISSRHDESARDFHGFPLLKNWQRRQCDKRERTPSKWDGTSAESS